MFWLMLTCDESNPCWWCWYEEPQHICQLPPNSRNWTSPIIMVVMLEVTLWVLHGHLFRTLYWSGINWKSVASLWRLLKWHIKLGWGHDIEPVDLFFCCESGKRANGTPALVRGTESGGPAEQGGGFKPQQPVSTQHQNNQQQQGLYAYLSDLEQTSWKAWSSSTFLFLQWHHGMFSCSYY